MRRTVMVAMAVWAVAVAAGIAATNASDTASAYTTATWTNGSVGAGSVGFGPWVLERTSTNDTQNGFLVGDSTLNGGGTNEVPDVDINTDGKAWGMYANSGQTASARRNLAGGALQVGQPVVLWMDNGYADGGSAIGVGLQNALGNSAVEVMFRGGNQNYECNSAAGLQDIGLPYTYDGVKVTLTLTSFTAFTGIVERGAANVHFGGALMNPAGGQVITQVRFFNFNAGGGVDIYNHYFNSMSVEAPPASTPVPATTIARAAVTNGNYLVSWPATNLVIYDVLVSTNLIAGTWDALSGGLNLVGNGPSLSISDPSRPIAFYRVRQRDS